MSTTCLQNQLQFPNKWKPNHHRKVETESPPESITHVYTKQHNTTGLQAPFFGPFPIVSRPTRSTVKIRVGYHKDNSPRYEVRHWRDLKVGFRRPEAPEGQRPQLGRPPAKPTTTSGSEPATEVTENMLTRTSQADQPTASKEKINKSAQIVSPNSNGAKIQKPPNPHGPVITKQMFDNADWPTILQLPSQRPTRSTRNPNPLYVDSMWTASEHDLEIINKSINSPYNHTRAV